MRFLLILASCYCLFLGCKRTSTEEINIQIDTYTPSSLNYPSKEIQIPDFLRKEFEDNFFMPWTSGPEELLASLHTLPGKELPYLEKYLGDDEWYGENKKPHTARQREVVVNNIDTSAFPNFQKKAVVVAHTNLRRIPTNRPGFDKYSKAGEGYPFDYFQETNLWANTPLQLLHLSKDKQWCYAISPYYKGWIPVKDIAIVDENFIQIWTTGMYAMPMSDSLPLSDPESIYALNTKMGMVLPYEETDHSEEVLAYYANADESGNAKLFKARVAKQSLAFDHLKFEEKTLGVLVSNLIGKPYGWGGNLENRDCSSMIRDLLATYKIWLPRDSKDQIEVGQQYELTGSASEKIKTIKEKGTPFLTILRKKGHNMLYVGESPQGEPLIMHAIWGLKTSYSDNVLIEQIKKYPIEGVHQDENGKVWGRHVIGEAVITSVTIGSGNNGITVPLIDEIYAMTNILEN